MTRDELILGGMQQVRIIAAIVLRRTHGRVEREDLVSEGYCGLVDAADRFDPSKGVAFNTFASRRIFGHMLDYLRRIDPLDRGHRNAVRSGNSPEVKQICIDGPNGVAVVVKCQDPLPDELAISREVWRLLDEAQISERHRQAMNLYYRDGVAMKVVAYEMGITEGRVSQLCAASVKAIRQVVKVQ